MDSVTQKFQLQCLPNHGQGLVFQQVRRPVPGASLNHHDSLSSLNRSLIGVQPENQITSDDAGRSQSGHSCALKKRKREIDDYSITTRDFGASLLSTNSTPDTADDHVLQHHFSAISNIAATHEHFPGIITKAPSVQQFTKHTVRWLQHANTAYAERKSVKTKHYNYTQTTMYGASGQVVTRKKMGVFFPVDYQIHELPSLSKSSRLGQHSLPKYFDRTYKNSFVSKDNDRSPSECLSAFFHGPTIACCATTMLACQYRAIETTIGTDEFNNIFGAPASKFRIARSLFFGSNTPAEFLSAEFGRLKPIDLVNPLFNLFDELGCCFSLPLSNQIGNKLTEADIKEGDILYIAGVDRYAEKHKTGDGVGYNLICTGQNSSGQNLYLGFSPDLFSQPKTYDQVKKILIDAYNQPQGPETIAAIERGGSGFAQLTNDTLPDDHPIVGLTGALRFNPSRWDYLALQRDKAWHRQPLMPVSQALPPVPLENGSPFPVEHFDSDFERFESFSSQQELMKITALKFTHAVIDVTVEPSRRKPMGLFLTGLPGVGKTHLCVAVAKKAAEHGVKTLYIDAEKVGDLINKHTGDMVQWHCDIDKMLAGKDLVVLDDANSKTGCVQIFLAKTMQRVLTDNIAIMVSSNNRIPVKESSPGFLDPLDKRAHNFLSLSDLQGDSRRSHWWQSREVQAADGLTRLGQYEGSKAAAVIIEQPVTIDDIARVLNISADQIRKVGDPFLPGEQRISPDFHCSDLSKTQHQAVVLEFNKTGGKSPTVWEVEQFINIAQKVHDEGLKLIVKTNNSPLFIKKVLRFLKNDILIQREKARIVDRLNHMFPEFLARQ